MPGRALSCQRRGAGASGQAKGAAVLVHHKAEAARPLVGRCSAGGGAGQAPLLLCERWPPGGRMRSSAAPAPHHPAAPRQPSACTAPGAACTARCRAPAPSALQQPVRERGTVCRGRGHAATAPHGLAVAAAHCAVPLPGPPTCRAAAQGRVLPLQLSQQRQHLAAVGVQRGVLGRTLPQLAVHIRLRRRAAAAGTDVSLNAASVSAAPRVLPGTCQAAAGNPLPFTWNLRRMSPMVWRER